MNVTQMIIVFLMAFLLLNYSCPAPKKQLK